MIEFLSVTIIITCVIILLMLSVKAIDIFVDLGLYDQFDEGKCIATFLLWFMGGIILLGVLLEFSL